MEHIYIVAYFKIKERNFFFDTGVAFNKASLLNELPNIFNCANNINESKNADINITSQQIKKLKETANIWLIDKLSEYQNLIGDRNRTPQRVAGCVIWLNGKIDEDKFFHFIIKFLTFIDILDFFDCKIKYEFWENQAQELSCFKNFKPYSYNELLDYHTLFESSKYGCYLAGDKNSRLLSDIEMLNMQIAIHHLIFKSMDLSSQYFAKAAMFRYELCITYNITNYNSIDSFYYAILSNDKTIIEQYLTTQFAKPLDDYNNFYNFQQCLRCVYFNNMKELLEIITEWEKNIYTGLGAFYEIGTYFRGIIEKDIDKILESAKRQSKLLYYPINNSPFLLQEIPSIYCEVMGRLALEQFAYQYGLDSVSVGYDLAK